MLVSTGPVRIGDSQVVTTLPKADNSVADVEITVPVENPTGAPVQATVRAAFNDVAVEKTLTLAPGQGKVVFKPVDFPQLSIKDPKLWWPNGYGQQILYGLRILANVDGKVSDQKDSCIGLRQMTYELSLMDSHGELRRVEVDYSKARQLGQDVTDGSHEGIRKVEGGWATSLTRVGEGLARRARHPRHRPRRRTWC